MEGDTVGVDLEGEAETAMIPFAWITDAKLSLSDALLKRGADARAARLAAETEDDDQENNAASPDAAEEERTA